MKILLSAYFCEPGKGSEEGVGWNSAIQSAKYHETWVLTRTENRIKIESEMVNNPIHKLHFIYTDLPFWTSKWENSQNGIQFHYYLWQLWIYFVISPIHKEIKFDVIRHVTFVRYWSPSLICLLDIPFIWGPIGGGESAPKLFWRDFSLRGKVYEAFRDMIRWIAESDPFVIKTAKRSCLALAATQDTAKRLQKMGVSQIIIQPAIALTNKEINLLSGYEIPDASPIRFISIGRLLHWKGFHLGLRGFALANRPDLEYWIVGSGAELVRLQDLSQQLGISKQVKFWGELPRQDVLSKLEECHVLIHPSLHDSGGLVCLEAMAAARPVICLDIGGPGIQVTKETGFKIVADNPDRVIEEIANSIRILADDSELRSSLGSQGRKLVKEVFNWDVKSQFFVELHQQVVTKKLNNQVLNT